MDYALTDLITQARTWVDRDIDPVTRAEGSVLVQRSEAGDRFAIEKLQQSFGSRISFGTAGLRSRLGVGPARMNRVVVCQTALALGRYLWEAGATLSGPSVIRSTRSSNDAPVVVVGYDARVNSEVFARDTAEILAGAGVRVVVFDGVVPTPVLAFAVRELDADAGVMITASHNPVGDSGYKVYLGGVHKGAQLVAPLDAEIARRIDDVAENEDVAKLPRGTFEVASSDVVDAYVARTAALVPEPIHRPRVAYTALHGVGSDIFRRVLLQAGFDLPIPVRDQDEPDGSFPTATVPNPEERGTLRSLLTLASEIGAEIALAHDPDADRVAVSVREPRLDGGPHRFRTLTGNELGLLLAWWGCDRATRENRFEGNVAASVVSTPAIESLAASFGYPVVRTLSGFKWIARVPQLIFGFEEAMGYLVNPQTLRDKDGISAGLAVLSLASELHASGITLLDKLDELVAAHGGFVGTQVVLRADPELIAERLTQLRRNAPKALGGLAVRRVDDYQRGLDRLPATNLLAWHLERNARVMLRPSGTEAKLKVYIDATSEADLYDLEQGVRALFDDD